MSKVLSRCNYIQTRAVAVQKIAEVTIAYSYPGSRRELEMAYVIERSFF